MSGSQPHTEFTTVNNSTGEIVNTQKQMKAYDFDSFGLELHNLMQKTQQPLEQTRKLKKISNRKHQLNEFNTGLTLIPIVSPKNVNQPVITHNQDTKQ